MNHRTPSPLDVIRLRLRLPAAPERRRIRTAAAISQRQIADACRVSAPAVARWESGSTPTDPATLARYVTLLEQMRSTLQERGAA